jgi:serine/threonine protein kinase
MTHLHKEGIIHRDLAGMIPFVISAYSMLSARNLLLSLSEDGITVQISDFGMSRVLLDGEANKTNSQVGPLKWYGDQYSVSLDSGMFSGWLPSP